VPALQPLPPTSPHQPRPNHPQRRRTIHIPPPGPAPTYPSSPQRHPQPATPQPTDRPPGRHHTPTPLL